MSHYSNFHKMLQGISMLTKDQPSAEGGGLFEKIIQKQFPHDNNNNEIQMIYGVKIGDPFS